MKILLVTHNPICTDNNMGKTFLSLFSQFDRDTLCQLYVHPSVPDVAVCHSYFQITDKQVLKSGPFGKPGRQVSAQQIALQAEKRKNGTLPPPAPWKGADPWKCLLRDGMWRMSNWCSSKLKAWLDQEDPTAIFVAPGYSKFIYNIALRIAEDRKIPIVTYICDDYYFLRKPGTLVGKWHLSALRKKTAQLMKKTCRLVTISRELGERYTQKFGVNTTVIMTGTENAATTKTTLQIKTVGYFGNLSLGRHESLAQIGRVLDEINHACGKNVVLRIYSGETDPRRLSSFQNIPCVKFCGFVTGKTLEEAMAETDLLVHTESFGESDMDMVKYSISTKIADSLAGGIPILAYGPETVASMGHLIRNRCAVTATSPDKLKLALTDAICNPQNLAEVLVRAKQTAATYHDKEKNSLKLRKLFAEMEETTDE